jgi:hypothetical protein
MRLPLSCFWKFGKAMASRFTPFLVSPLNPAKMDPTIVAAVGLRRFLEVTLTGSVEFAMSYGGGWRSCAHCAALQIAVAELTRMQTKCSCIKRGECLFNALDDPSNFSILDCEEGLRCTRSASVISSESTSWDLQSA